MAIAPLSIILFILLLFTSFVLSSAPLPPTQPSHSPPPPSPEHQHRSCPTNLVAFSSCLPYVATPPNNFSSIPAPACCGFYSLTFDSGDAICLCYLLRDPSMLGFPVNITRVLSLSSSCPRRRRSLPSSNSSLESICSGLMALSPLQSPGVRFFNHSNAGAQTSHPVTSTAPTSPRSAPPSPPMEPSDGFPDVSLARRIRSCSRWWFLYKGIFMLYLVSPPLIIFPGHLLAVQHPVPMDTLIYG